MGQCYTNVCPTSKYQNLLVDYLREISDLIEMWKCKINVEEDRKWGDGTGGDEGSRGHGKE